MSDEIETAIIATTEDNGDPVLRVNLDGSMADVIIDTEDECLNIWEINSKKKGDMKKMIDYLVSEIGYDWVQFIAPMEEQEKVVADNIIDELGLNEEKKFNEQKNNKDIDEVLNGFEPVTEYYQGKKVPMLVGFWDAEEDEE